MNLKTYIIKYLAFVYLFYFLIKGLENKLGIY